MNTRKINVGAITRDPALWPRGRLDEDRVQTFVGYLGTGDEALLPPIVVVNSRRTWLLADGWHRLAAAERCGIKTMTAEVAIPPFGQKAEDYVYELAVRTAVHSALPLTANERVAAIRRLIAGRPDLSDRAIGRLTGCSHVTVGKYRRAVHEEIEGAPGGHFDQPARGAPDLPEDPLTAASAVTNEPIRPMSVNPARHLPVDSEAECRRAAMNLVADVVRMVKNDHDHIAHDYLAKALILRFDSEQAGWWLAEMERIFFRAEQLLPSASQALADHYVEPYCERQAERVGLDGEPGK